MIPGPDRGVTPDSLRPGSEFDRVRALLGDRRGSVGSQASGLDVGPGDDAAVFGDLVLSTDLTVEDVHFRRSWLDLHQLGHRAVAVAVSDLGAMGARPFAVLWSLALPDEGMEPVRALGAGVREAVAAAGAVLAGGDLSRSPGPLVMDVVAVGRATDPVLRSTASPGEDLWVSGVLGGAAGAVSAWEEGWTPGEGLARRFQRPEPPLDLLRELRSLGWASAGIDVSDGLLADAAHVATASGVCLVVEEERVPLDPGLGAFPPARRLELGLTGGEDYEILFTAPTQARASLEAWSGGAGRGPTSTPPRPTLTRIGTVEPGSGVVRVGPGGQRTPVSDGGFDHFVGGGG